MTAAVVDINDEVDAALLRTATLVRLVQNQVGDVIEAGLLGDSPVVDNLTVLLETLEGEVETTSAAVDRMRNADKAKPAAPTPGGAA